MLNIPVEKEFNTAKQIVETVLKEDERARNNDLWLQLMVWQKIQGIRVYFPYEDIKRMIPSETITRVRRKIQNDELRYLPTDPEVRIKRHLREEDVKAWSVK